MHASRPIREPKPTKKEGLVVLPDGTHQHYVKGVLHREGAPAVHRGTDREEWYQHGRRHRRASDGPALIVRGVYRSFYCRGKLHNPHGPAVEYETGSIEFWLKGVHVPNDAVEAAVARELVRAAVNEALHGPEGVAAKRAVELRAHVQNISDEMRAELRRDGVKPWVRFLFDEQIRNGNSGRHKLSAKRTQVVRDLLKERDDRIRRRAGEHQHEWDELRREEEAAWAGVHQFRGRLDQMLAPWEQHLAPEWTIAVFRRDDNDCRFR